MVCQRSTSAGLIEQLRTVVGSGWLLEGSDDDGSPGELKGPGTWLTVNEVGGVAPLGMVTSRTDLGVIYELVLLMAVMSLTVIGYQEC